MSGSRLRVLCYHGICDDRLAAEPWMPSYFVTRSAFERQLEHLSASATVLPLADAVSRLKSGSLPPNAVCFTFDDGYANNLYLAMPLLQKYSAPASIFLSTAYVESGDWYPFLKLKFLRLADQSVSLPDYKTSPLDAVLASAAPLWPHVEARLTQAQRETLRPMTVGEVRAADPTIIEFGAHSHTHIIPRNETTERRRTEVRESVRKVAEWTGRTVRIYSYPNGEARDFGDIEKEALRNEGVTVAVSGIAGANRHQCDPLALRRYPLTLQHDEWRFRAEVAGLRTLMLSIIDGRVQ